MGAVDTFWVGRMGNALALAGQGAANQVFNAFFFVVGFVPKVTVPLVAASRIASFVVSVTSPEPVQMFVVPLSQSFLSAALTVLPLVSRQTPPSAVTATLPAELDTVAPSVGARASAAIMR